MSNSERKIVGIESFGIEIVERVSIPKIRKRLVSIPGGAARREREES